MNILQLISGGAKVISYRPDYHPIIKEINALVRQDGKAPKSKITAVLLFQQICYWGERSKGQFYKFREPCNHNAYQAGDSWTEELGMTGREFDTARSMIAVKTNDIANDYQKYPIVYWTDSQGVTHYKINADLLMDIVGKTHLTKAQTAIDKSANSNQQKRKSPNTEITTEITTKREAHATIDDLNPNYRHNQTLTKTPLSNREELALDIAARCLKVNHDTIKAHIFKSIHGNQPNLEPFQAFCKVVDIKFFESRLTSMLDNWSTTSWGKKNNPPTLGRIMTEWDKWDGNAINEFEMIQELLKVWDKGNGLDKARGMINSEPYEDINRKMKTVDFNRGIGFKGLSKFSVDDWSKLK